MDLFYAIIIFGRFWCDGGEDTIFVVESWGVERCFLFGKTYVLKMYPRSAGPSRMQLRGRTARTAGNKDTLPHVCGGAARAFAAAAGLHDMEGEYRGTCVGQEYGGAKAQAAQAASGAVRAQAYMWRGRDDVDFYFDVERSVGADDDEVRGVHSAAGLGWLMLYGGLHALQNYARRPGALSSFS